MRIEDGFILTRSSEDVGQGHQLKFYGIGNHGPFKILITNYKPRFFIERKAQVQLKNIDFTRKHVELKSFSQEKVDALYFHQQKDLYDAKDALNKQGVITFEDDIRPHEAFLMENFIQGGIEIRAEAKKMGGLHIYHNPSLLPKKYKPRLKILSLDIETSMKNDLYSLAIHQKGPGEEIKKVYMIGSGTSLPQENLFFYPSEDTLLKSFLQELQAFDPDIIVGWNIVGFDLSFLEKKCLSLGIAFNLGRENRPLRIFETAGNKKVAQTDGRVILDGIQVLKENFFKFENFKLETVAHTVLGKGKEIAQSGKEKVEEIEKRFKEDKKALAAYNLLDCTLVLDIFEQLSLIPLIYNRSTISGLPLDKLGLSIAAYDYFFIPRIHQKGYVSPNLMNIRREQPAMGGIVLAPEPGLYENIMVLDFKSLYPSIIATFNIDPLSRLLGPKDPLSTPVDITFSKKHFLLPQLIIKLMEERKKAKIRGDQPLAQAIKLFMNSFYGVMGSTHSRFYHTDLPNAITGTGRWIIEEGVKFLSSKNYKVIYGDTDSIFLQLEGNHNDLKETATRLTKEINDFFTTKIYRDFRADSQLEIEFEKFYKKLFFPQARTGVHGAKKRYAGLLLKGEERHLDFVGMEYVRSDWAQLAKVFQYELFKRFFNDEKLDDWIKNYLEQIKNGDFDHQLVFKKRLSKRPQDYTKNIPPHVKAALMLKQDENFPLKEISYVMTHRGPIPIELNHQDIDYNYYIDKQIKPLADGVLTMMGNSFEDLTMGDQLSLF
jgi:DNA polymerase-2